MITPGGEVERLMPDVLPQLPPGTLVHSTTSSGPTAIRTPRSRRYTEQTAVGALLQGGGSEILWASRHVATRTNLLAGTGTERFPLAREAFESSL